VAEAVGGLVARLRAGGGPFFVESRTTRWPGNYGSLPKLPGGDTEIAWAWDPGAPAEEVRAWHRESDPILLWARECERTGALTRDAMAAIDREVRDEIEEATAAALASPPPEGRAALEHAYA
jgi:TPP-dependent pyruvate/acetoin dehydrogenase alpha subunit